MKQSWIGANSHILQHTKMVVWHALDHWYQLSVHGLRAGHWLPPWYLDHLKNRKTWDHWLPRWYFGSFKRIVLTNATKMRMHVFHIQDQGVWHALGHWYLFSVTTYTEANA
jgi:hypothetical protein